MHPMGQVEGLGRLLAAAQIVSTGLSCYQVVVLLRNNVAW